MKSSYKKENIRDHVSLPKLRDQVSTIVSSLPPISYSRLASGEIDYYGATNTIANSLGLRGIPYTRASWLHGWITYSMISPGFFLTQDSVSCCKVREVPNLVATRSQQDFLRDHGYLNAKSVGLPFIYTHKPAVRRIPKSLLIIPAHSIKQHNINYEKGKASLFPSDISTLRKNFSEVVACIGGFCVQKHNYVEEYERAAVPWISGAWLHDQNALQRMRNLYSHFEFVATNSIGSHIPYAILSGCKVSYFGKGFDREREDYEQVHLYQKHPELIDIAIKDGKLQQLEQRFPFLFKDTEPTSKSVKWAEGILGVKHQIPPSQIAKLIGWKVRQKDANSWEYIPGENPGLD